MYEGYFRDDGARIAGVVVADSAMAGEIVDAVPFGGTAAEDIYCRIEVFVECHLQKEFLIGEEFSVGEGFSIGEEYL